MKKKSYKSLENNESSIKMDEILKQFILLNKKMNLNLKKLQLINKKLKKSINEKR